MPEGNPEIIGTTAIHDTETLLSKIGPDIIIDAAASCGRAHILFSYFRALRNVERGTAKGSSLATEFFRQITGERQVSSAIKKARIKEGNPAVIITDRNPEDVLKDLDLERDDSVIGCEEEDCEEECLERSALVEIL